MLGITLRRQFFAEQTKPGYVETDIHLHLLLALECGYPDHLARTWMHGVVRLPFLAPLLRWGSLLQLVQAMPSRRAILLISQGFGGTALSLDT